MHDLAGMIGVESLKAIRSKMLFWTTLGSLLMPLGVGFLIFLSRNPDLSKRLGLVSAKADLVAYAATDWKAYLGLSSMIIAAGGLILFTLIISWVFGREFADRTLKDMLAVPIRRSAILCAKFFTVACWSLLITGAILSVSLMMGALIGLPGGSIRILFEGSCRIFITALLVIWVTVPFAFLASIGRGYLLPIAGAILALMAANLVGLTGWGEYFPWGIPGFFAMSKDALAPLSYWIVLLTGVAGMAATHLWWKSANQNR